MGLLQYQRDSVIRKVHGLSSDQAIWSPVASGTSALWVLNHLATAEQSWILQRFAGGSGDSEVPLARDLSSACARYVEVSARVDAEIASHELTELCTTPSDDAPVNLRWILAHLLEETARHAGHLDLITEMLDGRTGR